MATIATDSSDMGKLDAKKRGTCSPPRPPSHNGS
jgi:hypothetical protein